MYPYEYINSFQRFDGRHSCCQKRLSIASLHVTVLARKITNTLLTYGKHLADLYLKTDVLLLSDVFETFRKTAQIHYGLDPAQYFNLPGMCSDALLKKSKIKLELLTDINMHLFIEKGLRGGISMVSKRHAKASNVQCPDYNQDKLNTWIYSILMQRICMDGQ